MQAPQPRRTGSYAASTKPQVQGHPSNKTLQYLADVPAEHPGQQAFYREALTGIPHPLEKGKTLSYGQLQDLLQGPQRAKALDAYRAAGRFDHAPTANSYLADSFDKAHAEMLRRAAANPGELAFPAAADAALRAPATATAVQHGNYVQPTTAGRITDAAVQAQRFGDIASR